MDKSLQTELIEHTITINVPFTKTYSYNEYHPVIKGRSFLVKFLGLSTTVTKQLPYNSGLTLINETVKRIYAKRVELNNFEIIKLHMIISSTDICFVLESCSEKINMLSYPIEKAEQWSCHEQNKNIFGI
jgi:hypothetical protein